MVDVLRDMGMFVWHLADKFPGDTLEDRIKSVNQTPMSKVLEHFPDSAKACKRDGAFSGISVSDIYEIAIGMVSYMHSSDSGENFVWIAGSHAYDGGFPTYQIGHKIASSFMLSSMNEEAVRSIKLPFPAFFINLPNKLLPVTGLDGNITYLKQVIVYNVPGVNGEICWGYHAMAEDNVSLWQHRNKPEDLLVFRDEDGKQPIFRLDFTDIDKRTNDLLVRLIISLSFYSTGFEKNRIKLIGKTHEVFAKGRRRYNDKPLSRIFRVIGDVSHDFHNVVSDYVHGDGKKITVQSLVAGHWRHQAYGEGRKLRKYIFIDPYWRGPEDAPIAKREHKL